jgi:hypothetical protein
MIIHYKILLAILIMLLTLTGIPAVSEASSHGLAELTGDTSEEHTHHDASNHSHESVDCQVIQHIVDRILLAHQTTSSASDSPRSVRYRIDRPPK